VGSCPDGASPYGALDMVSNVWEWVADRYDEDYHSHSPGANPQGPDSGQNRVVRGGSWVNDTNAVWATNPGPGQPRGRAQPRRISLRQERGVMLCAKRSVPRQYHPRSIQGVAERLLP